MSGGGTNWKKIAQAEICEFSFMQGLRAMAQDSAPVSTPDGAPSERVVGEGQQAHM